MADAAATSGQASESTSELMQPKSEPEDSGSTAKRELLDDPEDAAPAKKARAETENEEQPSQTQPDQVTQDGADPDPVSLPVTTSSDPPSECGRTMCLGMPVPLQR